MLRSIMYGSCVSVQFSLSILGTCFPGEAKLKWTSQSLVSISNFSGCIYQIISCSFYEISMASICFLTRYDEYFKILYQLWHWISKYTSSLENALILIWDLVVHNWDFLRFILTRPSASSLSESFRRGFFLCQPGILAFHWGYLTPCHRWSQDEGSWRGN